MTEATPKPEFVRCRRCGLRPDQGEASCRLCGRPLAAEVDGLKAHAGAVPEFFRGLAYFPKGLYLLLANRPLWRLAAVPLIMNVAFLILAFIAAYFIQNAIHERLVAKFEGWSGWFWGSLEAILNIAVYGLDVIAFLIVPLIVAWLFTVFGKLLFMPFLERLSAQAERLVLGLAGDAGDKDDGFGNMVIALLDALLLTACQLLGYLILLPLHVIPVLGSLLWFLIPGAFFTSMDYTDMNLVRRRYPVRERLALWRRYPWRFLGFGLAFFTLLTIPFLNIVAGAIIVPVAALGGTMLYLELDAK